MPITTVNLDDKIKDQIISALKPLNPLKIILFGSRAYGHPSKESDIDLYIVTKDSYMPSSFNDKMELKLKIAEPLKKIRQMRDIDIIVHTRPMQKKFFEMDSLFSRKINNEGIVLYESSSESTEPLRHSVTVRACRVTTTSLVD
ncbi:MAG: nucleotidyltransferase domain-containing protein [Desulfamplus sp.]|nr:nucleotidyltransferase domain-containing protein [Desulfamplus sp.]